MLGASKAQLIGIKAAKAMGHEVIVCDYLEDAVGHEYSDRSHIVSTFDHDGVLAVADREEVEGIMTLGTDQPVLTAAYASENLELPTMLDSDTARAVTNKLFMKKTFTDNGIPTVDYLFYEKGINDHELDGFKGPVVIKPVDSQGQRGIYLLEEAAMAKEFFDRTIAYSRERVVLIERHYPHEEITVSGWVDEGRTTVLTITDRVTFDEENRIGICLSHEFPSKHLKTHGDEIIGLTERLVEVFGIGNGPIYFQMLIGEEGIKVNEIACRIGGAYEAHFMPALTGFDILKAHICKALGQEADMSALKSYDVMKNRKHLSVQLFFSSPCMVAVMPEESEILAMEGVLDVGYNIRIGDMLSDIENATARAGYVIIEAESDSELRRRVGSLYNTLVILDDKGVNHIIHRTLEGY